MPSDTDSGLFSGTELRQWCALPATQHLLSEEQKLIAELCAQAFGYHLAVLSYLGSDLDYLSACAIRHRFVVAQEAGFGAPDLLAQFGQLPLATDSVDAVILQHTLEFSADPRQVLREVERVLIPEGRLLICSFNPLSLAGLRRLLPGARNTPPWGGHFISYPRLHDWLSLLGFDVEQLHCPTLNRAPAGQGIKGILAEVENYGYRFLPWLAGVYVVQAVKRVSTVTPIRPRWRIEANKGLAVAEPGASQQVRRERQPK